ncbi:hypothetical protein D187_006443 [Cystobacter fuscus DSM 2262]|uniref:Uncharacterized protein n=1 Tax=Cystobacter fuscus (strain ATCC 25194 / DSM 2262 / NBRC 100088 / M29) TaxID=1242864 RepID=S9R298_CYSF2|nr:hypothetical protein D187_006443 [Cystobacter fuscus DSM 2262]
MKPPALGNARGLFSRHANPREVAFPSAGPPRTARRPPWDGAHVHVDGWCGWAAENLRAPRSASES